MPRLWEGYAGCGKSNLFQNICKETNRRAAKKKPNERHGAIHEIQQERDTVEKEFDVVRAKTCNFHSIISVLITKLKTKASPKTSIIYCKVNTGNDSN